MIRVQHNQSFGGGGRPVDDAYFLFMFELPQGQNARGVMDRLREDVRAFFADRDLDYGMGALGGDFRCYGHARRLRGPTTEDDRPALAGWVAAQSVCGMARLGALEPLDAEGQVRLRQPTEWVFSLDGSGLVPDAKPGAVADGGV